MTLLNVAQIIIAVVLILVILVQSRGGSLGGIFGGMDSASAFRTRRGIEKTLFRFTIILVAVFILVSILSVKFG
ncbi:preprotein translocase subunit SecG [Chloroflexota bacterium]